MTEDERVLIRNHVSQVLSGYAGWIRSEVVDRSDARVAVYGAGSHTELLLEVWSGLGLPHWSHVLVTETPTSPTWRDFPVSRISEMSPEEFDLIVLSSRTYESDMAEVCRQRFPAVPRIAIWTSVSET